MYGTLLFVSNKKYKKDKVLEIMKQYCYDADIPETLFGTLNSSIVIEKFNATKPPEFMVMMAEKKYRETKSEKYAKRLEEYHALKHGDIERYYNLQENFGVRRGKVYTTKNILNGKYKSVAFSIDDDFQKLLTKKNGNYVDVCKKEELADYVFDSISLFFDFDHNQWHETIKPLVVNDGEDFNYQEASERAKLVKESRLKMKELINNIEPDRYCYGLLYQV